MKTNYKALFSNLGIKFGTAIALIISLVIWSESLSAAGMYSMLPPPPPKYGLYTETVEDMRVKVHGGYIRVERTRKDKLWHINRRWEEIVRGPSSKPVVQNTGPSPGGSSINFNVLKDENWYALYGTGRNDGPYDSRYVTREGTFYNNTSKDRYVFEENPWLTITERNSPNGIQDFLWEDRKGNWINYKSNGLIETYGDKNNVQVTFTYNGGNNISGVFDTLGKQILWYEYNTEGLVSSIRDYSGRKVQYFYETVTLARSRYWERPQYDLTKQLSKVIDVNGNTWLYEYDGAFLVKKTDPEGRITNIKGGQIVESVLDQDNIGVHYTYDYNKTSKEFYRQEKTTGGKVTEHWFDKVGDLQRQDINGVTQRLLEKSGNTWTISDVNGQKTIEQYDTFRNLLKRTYPDGDSVSFSVDTRYSNITQKTDENGIVTRYEYAANGNLKKKVEAVGRPETRTTEYDYDAYGNITNYRRLADGNTALAEIILTYDDFGNIKTLTDAEGYVSTFSNFDVMGNPRAMNDARGKDWIYAYDAKGNLTKVTDPLTRDTTYTYNKVDDLAQVVDVGNRTILYGYNNQHRLTSLTYPDLSVHRYEYHPDGMVSKDIDESGITTTYKYDTAGRILQVTDGNGNITKQIFNDAPDFNTGGFHDASKIIYPTYEHEIKYDKRQRAVLHTVLDGGAGSVYRNELDGVGNIISYTNPEEKTEFLKYDAYSNLIKFTNNLLQDTLAEYDNRDNLIKLTDAKTQEHLFVHDRKNLLTLETRPLGETLQFGFDGDGNLTSHIDAKNQKAEYIYDDVGRQTDTRYYAAGNFTTPLQSIVFGYDAGDNNNSWSISGDSEADRNMVGSSVYNNVNQLTSETVNYGPFSKTYSYSYHPNGSKKSITYPNGTIYSYAYDAAGLLNSVGVPGQGSISVNSKKWLAPEKITLPGGTTQNFGINNRLVVTSITVKDPAANVVSQQQLVLNKLQNITQRVSNSNTFDYSYDDNNRLTGVDKNTSTIASYDVDPVGNRISLNSSTPWQYNANNELLNQGGITYTYDNNGNQTLRAATADTKNFIYDVDNHLIRVEDASNQLIARYAYDPFDQRLWKKTSSQSTYYLYSEEGLIAEYGATGQLQQSYGYKPDSLWTTAPLFTTRGGQYYYYQNDDPNAGTPQKLTASNGSVVWSAEYDAFGQAQVSGSASVQNNLRLAGQYYDAETGLHYNWKRYYDSETGRYITTDPIGFEGGVNLYSYVNADPINWIDPNGECGLPGAAFSIVIDIIFLPCGGSMTVESLVSSAIQGALCVPPWLKAANKLKKMNKKRPGPPNCFVAGTLVHTKDGLKSIEEIKVGDIVASKDETTGETAWKKVTDVFVNENKAVLNVTIINTEGKEETLGVTEEHPFWINGQGWVNAGDLNSGDQAVSIEGEALTVKAMASTAELQTTYNFEVDGFHTYFVGEDGIFVHNACKSPNQMNQQIKKGNAPKGIKRVDTGKTKGEQTHVHFDNGSALNKDGSWKHGKGNITNAQNKWLKANGWNVPK